MDRSEDRWLAARSSWIGELVHGTFSVKLHRYYFSAELTKSDLNAVQTHPLAPRVIVLTHKTILSADGGNRSSPWRADSAHPHLDDVCWFLCTAIDSPQANAERGTLKSPSPPVILFDCLSAK